MDGDTRTRPADRSAGTSGTAQRAPASRRDYNLLEWLIVAAGGIPATAPVYIYTFTPRQTIEHHFTIRGPHGPKRSRYRRRRRGR